MNSKWVAERVSRRGEIILLAGALVILSIALGACQPQQPSAEAIQTAIAQTAEAKSEVDSLVETRVAEILGVSASVASAEPSSEPSPVPPTDTATPLPEDNAADTPCTEDCADEVQSIVAATVTKASELLVEQATFEARFGVSAGGGGPAEPVVVEVDVESVNVRTGPSQVYPVLIQLYQGDRVPVIAKAQNGWLNVNLSLQLGRTGWVSGDYVSFVEGDLSEVEIVATIPPTPRVFPTVTPTPAPSTPSATPGPAISFAASRTALIVGQTSELSWKVSNVQAVYLFPVGANWLDYPVTGEGTRLVQPFVTTTYRLRVVENNGTTVDRDIEITVNASLNEGTWRLKSYVNISGTLVSALPSPEVNARFGLFSRVDGSGGCNSYTGDYTAYDKILLIAAISPTSSTCANNIMQQESAFFLNMRRATTMTITANDLAVQDSAGRTILTFSR